MCSIFHVNNFLFFIDCYNFEYIERIKYDLLFSHFVLGGIAPVLLGHIQKPLLVIEILLIFIVFVKTNEKHVCVVWVIVFISVVK